MTVRFTEYRFPILEMNIFAGTRRVMAVAGVFWVILVFWTLHGSYRAELQILFDTPMKRPVFSGLLEGCPVEYFRRTTDVTVQTDSRRIDVNVCFKELRNPFLDLVPSVPSYLVNNPYIEYKFQDSDKTPRIVFLDKDGNGIESQQNSFDRTAGTQYLSTTLLLVKQNLTGLLNPTTTASEPEWIKRLGWIRNEETIQQELKSGHRKYFRAYIFRSIGWAAAGLAVGLLIMFIGGWIARGFFGISMGRDSK